MNTKKLYISILILTVVFFLSISALFDQCKFSGVSVREEQAEEVETEVGAEPENEKYSVAYFEVSIDESSMHFEHRMASVSAVNPDGTDEKLIYSDLNEKYDLGRIYSVSPDSSRISCGFYEGGRGAYSELRVIDINTGDLISAVEFDYTETQSMELMADIYGEPVWSHDSKRIAFETVTNPYSDDFSDGRISIVNINTGDIQDVDLDKEIISDESTTFIYPVLFSRDDDKLFCILITFYPKMEDGAILDYFSRIKKLLSVDISSGEVKTILTIDEFTEGEMSFDNFNLFIRQDMLTFQVVGDFEEDGDIWVCSSDGSNLSKLTGNTDLREQQPSILEIDDTVEKIAYMGVKRYGTISSHLNSGDIYTMNIDGSEQNRVTNYEIGAVKPIFSPDGRYLAFIHYIYDDNMEYVESSQIEVYDIETEEIKIVASGTSIFELIGWIRTDIR